VLRANQNARGENGILLFTETTAFHKNGELCVRHQKPNAEMPLISTIDLMQSDTTRYLEQPSRALLCSSYCYHIPLLYYFPHTSQNRRDFFKGTWMFFPAFILQKLKERSHLSHDANALGMSLMYRRMVCTLDSGSLWSLGVSQSWQRCSKKFRPWHWTVGCPSKNTLYCTYCVIL